MNTALSSTAKFLKVLIPFVPVQLNTEKPTEKPLSEILPFECVRMKYRNLHLSMYNNGVHHIATLITMYFRPLFHEYIIVLDTEEGYLVARNFDLEHAESEFTFIC